MTVATLLADCVYGDPPVVGPFADAVGSAKVRLVIAALPSTPTDPLDEWFTRPVAGTIERLRQLDALTDRAADQELVILLWILPVATSAGEQSARAAAVESLRGIVQSITREKADAWAPVNGIAVSDHEVDSAVAVVRFLSEPDGRFTAGSTFDLTAISEHVR